MCIYFFQKNCFEILILNKTFASKSTKFGSINYGIFTAASEIEHFQQNRTKFLIKITY